VTALAWWKVRLQARDDEVPQLEALLETLGALAVTVEAHDGRPVFAAPDDDPPGLWSTCWVEALFDGNADCEALRARIADAGFSLADASQERVADRDWHLAWRDQFVPLCFAERLWVVPTWHSPPRDAGCVIRLDPGMAFGTGTHPTTALCLEWLASHADVAGRRVLDYGCGSGILAIAAAKLSAASVVGIDLDPQACAVARENAISNDCRGIVIGEPADLAEELFDVIIANLLMKPVLELRQRFADHLDAGGDIALSGLLVEQVPAVLEAYRGAFTMNPPVVRGEWALVTGRRC
jgi:ribosomal protein L11 methyltransferase